MAWSSSDEAVATVSDSGLVISAGNGTAQVTARSGDLEETVDVSVMQAASSIVLETEEAWAVPVGETVQLVAVVLDRNEHPIADAVVAWSSSDESVATVSPEGLVTAVGEGSAQVTVSSGDAAAITYFVVSSEEADPELQALVALYNATDGRNWADNTNWLRGEPLDTWYGISTDHEGHIWSLWLPENQLSGPVPPELGQLLGLRYLNLFQNQMSGEIPTELGQLENLVEMNLHDNQLTGTVPESFGGLTNLNKLDLSSNGGLSGRLPMALTGLMLEELRLDLTRLCELEDSELWDWLNTIPISLVNTCSDIFVVSTKAILTQSTQTLGLSVPLVAGEEALLRVFISAPAETPMPPISVRFYLNHGEVYVTNIGNEGKVIPPFIDAGDLDATANAIIPASVIQPTLEMVIEIYPDGTSDASVPLPDRLPAVGAIPVTVHEIPPMRLTVVSLVWTKNPDEMLLAEVNSLTAGSEYFRPTMTYLPAHELNVDVRIPFWVSDEPVHSNSTLVLTRMIRNMDGADWHYLGIISEGEGRAFRPGLDAVSELNAYYIGHELGHNFSLGHAPCGRPTGIDENYPYSEGNIGVWGFDIRNGELVPPFTPDHMSGCGPPDWTSDYNFSKAVDYRLSGVAHRPVVSSYSPTGKSLLIRGGLDEDGELTWSLLSW